MTQKLTRPNKFKVKHVLLAHGNGGRLMRELIEQVFAHHLHNELLDTNSDAAFIPFENNGSELVSYNYGWFYC